MAMAGLILVLKPYLDKGFLLVYPFRHGMSISFGSVDTYQSLFVLVIVKHLHSYNYPVSMMLGESFPGRVRYCGSNHPSSVHTLPISIEAADSVKMRVSAQIAQDAA